MGKFKGGDTFSIRLPNSDHKINVTVYGAYSYPATMEDPPDQGFDDVEYEWDKTGRPVKPSCIYEKLDGLWDFSNIEDGYDPD